MAPIHLALLTFLLAAFPGSALVAQPSSSGAASRYEVRGVEAAGEAALELAPMPALEAFTVSAVRRMLPTAYTGRNARIASIDDLYFLRSSNIVEMDRLWSASGRDTATCIVLGRGSYTLESVWSQLGDSGTLSRDADGAYLLSRPLYIAPTASLSVRSGEILRLSANDGVFIYSNGTLRVVDAQVLAWDVAQQRPSPREPLTHDNVLLYSSQTPRPYILASEGSKTYLAGSRFLGLGYKGTTGTFGISLTPSISDGRIGEHLQRLPPPTGWLIGNRIEELFFGFYSNRARDVAIVGNVFSNNVVYGIDPHDYSERLVVARNVSQGARFAHGIIFSRGVVASWVVENLAVSNAGSGIMMDRSSTHNLLARNLVLGNRGDGIAIFESSHNRLRENVVERNLRNGVFVRNSVRVDINANVVSRNGRSAIELAAVDIADLETRDFALDPFEQEASALVTENAFHDNGRSAIAMDAARSLTLHRNTYRASGPLFFDGNLQAHASELLAGELSGGAPIQLRRRGPAPQGTSEAARAVKPRGFALREASPVLQEHARRGAPRAMIALARHHLRNRDDDADLREGVYWYARAIAHARVSAMSELGILLAGHRDSSGKQRHEGLVLLAMASQLGDLKSAADLSLLPDMLAVDPRAIDTARDEAKRRLRARVLWNAEVFPAISLRLGPEESAQARRRVTRLLQQPPAIRAPSVARRLDPEGRARYTAHTSGKNDKRTRLMQRLEQSRQADAQAVGERRSYLDRVEQRDDAVSLRAQNYSDRQWQELVASVVALLERVNGHRNADDPVTLEQIVLPTRQVGAP